MASSSYEWLTRMIKWRHSPVFYLFMFLWNLCVCARHRFFFISSSFATFFFAICKRTSSPCIDSNNDGHHDWLHIYQGSWCACRLQKKKVGNDDEIKKILSSGAYQNLEETWRGKKTGICLHFIMRVRSFVDDPPMKLRMLNSGR